MTRALFINVGVGEIRIAGVRDGKLVRFSIERILDDEDRQQHSLIGNIILGRVEKIMPAMDAAFVGIGLERSGFLGAREAQILGGEKISDCVREGEAVLVQIVKDPIADKGARLTAALSLAGRLCVLTLNRTGLNVSRRVEDEAERARLITVCQDIVPDGMGLILRTAAFGASREDIISDIRTLLADWQAINGARAMAKPPITLHHELGAVARTLRDMVTPGTDRIVLDDAETLAEARAYCRRAMPNFESRLEYFPGPGAMLDEWEDDIERLQNIRVGLPCGGWITIEITEALTAIDVNSGSFAQSSGREETGLTVNLEAAAEIGRQLCLRGIGGLIVADFIHVESEKHRARIVAALEQSLSEDSAPSHISPMSELGLVAITRRRVGESLTKRLSVPCVCCSGKGRMPAEATVALAALRRAEREAQANPGRAIAMRAAPDVIDWLRAHQDSFMPRLTRRGVSRLALEAEAHFAREVFDVRAL